jgi:hypothetical protein
MFIIITTPTTIDSPLDPSKVLNAHFKMDRVIILEKLKRYSIKLVYKLFIPKY